MQALKDAGIVLVLLLLVFSVRITPIESADAVDTKLLAPPVEAATTDVQVLPVTTEVLDHCSRIVLEPGEEPDAPEPYVVVFETEEAAEGTPCPRT